MSSYFPQYFIFTNIVMYTLTKYRARNVSCSGRKVWSRTARITDTITRFLYIEKNKIISYGKFEGRQNVS